MSMYSEKNAPLMALRLFVSIDCSPSDCAMSVAVRVFIVVSKSLSALLIGFRAAWCGVVTASGRRSLRFVCLDRFRRDAERSQRQRRAAIHGRLHQYRADLVLRHAVAQRALHVHGQFVMLAHRREHA